MTVTAPATSTPLTVYRRDITASVPRIWENVLDWEHLPWLHRGAFLGVRLLEAWHDGWRAEILLPPATAARSAEIAVRLDRPALRYHTTTLTGFGAGSDIVTELAPIDATTTAIAVAFHVPGIDVSVRDRAAAYTALYRRLWDEDEAMMVRRQALLDAAARRARAGVARDGAAAHRSPELVDGAGTLTSAAPPSLILGHEDAVRARLPLVVAAGDDEYRLVDVAGEIVAHTTVCPHLGGPLAECALDGRTITCPWHGYRFDVRSGANVDGRPSRLAAAPRVVIDPTTSAVSLHR